MNKNETTSREFEIASLEMKLRHLAEIIFTLSLYEHKAIDILLVYLAESAYA
jgi:hypothetical protein